MKVKLVSKGNGRNYYGYTKDGVEEVIKVRGLFYFTKYIIGEWLIPIGQPIRNFILVN